METMSLSEEYQQAFEEAQIEAQENYGDISEKTRNNLAELERKLDLNPERTIENVAYSIKKNEAEILARKSIIDMLTKKNDSAKKYIVSAKIYIRCTMETVRIKKVKGAFMTVFLGEPSQHVFIRDESKIDNRFFVEKRTASLSLITDELNKDKPEGVDGAEFEKGEKKLRIS